MPFSSVGQRPSAVRDLLMPLVSNMAIRHKLVVVIMITCILALTMASLIFVGYQHMDTRQAMVKRLRTQAEMIGHNCQAALAFGVTEDAEEVLEAFRAESAITYACIHDQEGRLFTTYAREDTRFAVPLLNGYEMDSHQFTKGFLRVSKVILLDGDYAGAVTVWSDLRPLKAMFRRNVLISVGVMLLATLAAYLLSGRIQGVISSPILDLAEVARSVSEQQEYSTRAEKVGNDEVGFLIDSFNDMLQQIQERDLALVSANERLEGRVKDRTAKLSQTNEQLKAEIGHRNRAEQALRERSERIIHHQSALLKLGQISESDMASVLSVTVEEVAQTLDIDCVSIWMLEDDEQTLRCQKFYSKQVDARPLDMHIATKECPKYIQALEASRIVAAVDAHKDPRTQELVSGCLREYGIASMMDVPLRLHGRLVGVICHEQARSTREWTLEEQDFAGSVADMIVLKLERLERQKAQAALQDSERRYRTLLQNIPQKICYKDKNSRYLLCNESYAQDLGLAHPDEICGQSDFDFHPEEFARKYMADDVRIMSSGEAEEIEEQYMHEGRELTIQALKSPVCDADGRVIGIFIIFWDVTARKEAERALEGLNLNLKSTVEELRRSNKELQDFAYVTAHDLKAPLRAIGTLTDWIYTDYHDKFDQQGREQMQLVKGRVSRMNELIDSILRYSEIGRGTRNLQNTNLETLVTDTIAMLAPPETFEIQVEGPFPVVTCERVRLIQVFQNLIGNAIKFMDKPEGKIHLGCTEQAGYWEFWVSDNGPGIHEKYFEKIFRMFQTLTPRDELESTGIGLAVVKKIVELYNGKLWVESTQGQGATFFFTLPKPQEVVNNQTEVALVSA